MNDLISRQKAINTVNAMFKVCDTGSIEDFRDLMLAALTDLPPVRQWIPCSEQLPDDGVNVLVQFIDGYTEICRLLGGCWEVLYGEYTGVHTAVAWMPLPEPYKGDD